VLDKRARIKSSIQPSVNAIWVRSTPFAEDGTWAVAIVEQKYGPILGVHEFAHELKVAGRDR
jgi:hypothetical protein